MLLLLLSPSLILLPSHPTPRHPPSLSSLPAPPPSAPSLSPGRPLDVLPAIKEEEGSPSDSASGSNSAASSLYASETSAPLHSSLTTPQPSSVDDTTPTDHLVMAGGCSSAATEWQESPSSEQHQTVVAIAASPIRPSPSPSLPAHSNHHGSPHPSPSPSPFSASASSSMGSTALALAHGLSSSAGLPGVILRHHPSVVHATSLVGSVPRSDQQPRHQQQQHASEAVAVRRRSAASSGGGEGSSRLPSLGSASAARASAGLASGWGRMEGSLGSSLRSVASDSAADERGAEEEGGGEEEVEAGVSREGEEGGEESQYFFGEEEPSVRPSRQMSVERAKEEEGYARQWLAGRGEGREEEGCEEDEEEEEDDDDDESYEGNDLYDEETADGLKQALLHSQGEGRLQLGEDHTVLQAVGTVDFWLLYCGLVCGFGAGLTAITNLAQIAQAQGFQHVHVLTSLISICQFLGRLAGGAVSEQLVR